MKVRRAVVAGVVAGSLCSCGGGSSPLPTTDHPSQARSIRPMTQAEVDESMTTLTELPKGFSVDPKGQVTDLFIKGTSAKAIPDRCTPAVRAEQNFDILATAFAKGHADFTDGASRLVGVTIYSFQSPYPPGNLSDDLFRAVRDCPSVTFADLPGATETASLFDTAGLGDESVGMRFRTTYTSSSEVPVELGVEITRVGDFDVLMTAELVQDGTVDTALLGELTRAAVGRML